jgi:lipopolysaccharide/colanic/teichoic acid biosynthesis glycosyltransferase
MKNNVDSYNFHDPNSAQKDKLPLEVGVSTLVNVITLRFLTILLVAVPIFLILTIVWLLPNYSQFISALLLGLTSIIWSLFAVSVFRKKASLFDKILKRAVDLFGSMTFLIFMSPVMAVIAMFIKIESKGPVFFSQRRIGKDGKQFRMLKFRTMKVVDVDLSSSTSIESFISQENSEQINELAHNQKFTRIGLFIRKTSLDVLPQIYNVFKGDMSLVGPRPLIPDKGDRIEDKYIEIFKMTPPGITGLWQVSGRNGAEGEEERLKLDEYYAKNWSLWLDLSILLKTVTSVLRSAGAY